MPDEAPAGDTRHTPDSRERTAPEADAVTTILGLLPGDDEPDPSNADRNVDGEHEDEPARDEDRGAGEHEDEPEPLPTYRVKVDGEDVEVTLDELTKGYSRTADYTRKTQKLSEERKALETEQERIRARQKEYAERITKLDQALGALEDQEPDWEKIRKESPDEYPVLHADWQRAKEKRERITRERARVEQEQQQERQREFEKYVAREQEHLADAVPDFKDPAKGKTARAELFRYGESVGFTPEELQVVTDHRAVILLRKAMLYDQLQSRRKDVDEKNKSRSTPTAPPGGRDTRTPSTAKTRAADEARKRLRRSGRLDDAVSLIETMLD